MESLTAVTAADFEARVLQSTRPVVVDFATARCAPCLTIAPLLAELAAELADRAVILSVDGEAEIALAARYGVRGFPTLIGFRNGAPVAQHVGAARKDALRDFVLRVASPP